MAEAKDAGGADAVVDRFAAEAVGIDGVVLALFFLEAELELVEGGVEIPVLTSTRAITSVKASGLSDRMGNW